VNRLFKQSNCQITVKILTFTPLRKFRHF
jgi:hypothetical protein